MKKKKKYTGMVGVWERERKYSKWSWDIYKKSIPVLVKLGEKLLKKQNINYESERDRPLMIITILILGLTQFRSFPFMIANDFVEGGYLQINEDKFFEYMENEQIRIETEKIEKSKILFNSLGGEIKND